jgi:hypothetical protein
VCALSIVFIAKSAAAAPAPMCNEDGQSIAAPFPLWPTKNGELKAEKRCDNQGFQLGKAPPPERDHQRPAAQTVERALPVWYSIPSLRGIRLPAPRGTRQRVPSGFYDSLFRPPRLV